jgi:hypothetical protein
VDLYSRMRRVCLKDGMSAREAVRYFDKDHTTMAKMLRHALPPGYRRSEAPRHPPHLLGGPHCHFCAELRKSNDGPQKQHDQQLRQLQMLCPSHGLSHRR